MYDARLDSADLEVIEAGLMLLEAQGDASQAVLVERLRQKIEFLGIANKVSWGRDLTHYMMEQVTALEKGALPLADLLADIDGNFTHGRDDVRNGFMEAIKDLARKIAAETSQGLERSK